jgi:hypothetical protein
MYGDKKDYHKIDIFVDGLYDCSTTWAASLVIAKEQFLKAHSEVSPDQIKVSYA